MTPTTTDHTATTGTTEPKEITTMSIRRLTAVGALVALAVAVPTLPAQAAPAGELPRPDHASQAALVAQVRAATARFHDVEVALAEGYVDTHECSSSPDGAMGIHFINPALIAPGAPVDPTRPPVLMYGPSASGELEFWGVEFFEPDVGQPTPVFGTVAFDGPMPGHDPEMPVHYDLHVWTGKHNPSGLYAPFNPSLSC
ncbi:PepSY domain-containing protein [Agromyces bracchium]|uniref:Uncharacterized protein n=1 Tax=Agromyces bracchium TaxID=88376 RepID=A0A6I3M684_9MICO|nr:PepSY domain-containing protein [Agromyces bracchium]MTH66846.1 hypothetical protein [Agromyces bracchium]